MKRAEFSAKQTLDPSVEHRDPLTLGGHSAGSTPQVYEYQRRFKFKVGSVYASRQLAETRSSILSIALTAGFADQAHFSRTFRDHTGMTPARFRAAFGIEKPG